MFTLCANDEKHQPLRSPVHTDLTAEFRRSVVYNYSRSRSYNLVSQYGNYHFGGWNEIDSPPDWGKLYIVEPSKYSGLRYSQWFYIVDRVDFPNGDPAFYLVGAGY